MTKTMIIPATQKAALLTAFGKDIEIQYDYPVPAVADLTPGQCLVRLDVSGVCHSDLHIQRGEFRAIPTFPFIGGHEGIGTIVALSPGTQATLLADIGRRVGIKWLADACTKCELCRTGYEPLCTSSKLSGYTTNGTFSEYVVAAINHVVPIPDNVDSKAAVSILCAGLTVYKGLKVSNTKVGNWVVIPGAGGGLGHLAIQYAVAMGLRVLAIDTGAEKKRMCLEVGAEKWIDFRESADVVKDVVEACDGRGPHAALITSPSGIAYDNAIMYLRPTGTLVCVAMASPEYSLRSPVGLIIGKSLTIVGSVLGNLQDAIEALDLVARKKVKTHFSTRKLEEINDVFQELHSGQLVGRAVIQF
ncbi:mannitol-1-phosphate dehydrogenase MPDH1 [Artomyces pyxidatus]|uniref:Mannitol-1-phosphate dehydrogenase MPDH1 n=1 Tax=Artomyces pyxidatus TaxID=48021 RepID=A0ACB8T337_9AGAM|nr:mannitol-1-phosphate dehydrogenase MPDH1 [Artomyces pyxidatus]